MTAVAPLSIARRAMGGFRVANDYTALFGPERIALVGGVYLAVADRLVPSWRELLAIVFAHLTASALLCFNNYRDRITDEHNPKARHRPLAGRPERVRWYEVMVVAMFVTAVAGPWFNGSTAQALANAAAIVLYVGAFADRRSRHPWPVLKTASATVVAAMACLGLLLALGASSEEVVGVTLVVTTWRVGFELGVDALEAESDRAVGVRSLITVCGTRGPLVTVAVLGSLVMAGVSVWHLVASDSGTRGALVGLTLLSGLLLLISAMAVAVWNDRGSWDFVRQTFAAVLLLCLPAFMIADHRIVALVLLLVGVANEVRYFLPRDREWLQAHRRAAPAIDLGQGES